MFPDVEWCGIVKPLPGSTKSTIWVPDRSNFGQYVRMSFLPERHPSLDLFVLDIADAMPKGHQISNGPLFVCARHKVRHLTLQHQRLAFASEEVAKGNAPKSAGAAFVGYCKMQETHR